MLSALFRPPRLWPPHGTVHRRVTWMELFYDLIFVAAIAQVAEPLAHHYAFNQLFRYTLLFVLIWWAWSGQTMYNTHFQADDGIYRTLLVLQCFTAAVMAANARDALDSRSSAGFAAAYGAMRFLLAGQYLRARAIAATRRLTTRYAAGFSIAGAIWIASSMTGAPLRYWLWGSALLIDFVTPWLGANDTVHFPPDAHHLPERFGLFTIILLGDLVASVMRGIESQETWTPAAAATALSAMTFGFLLRWWYFDVADGAAERRITTRRQARLFQAWNYAHLPWFLGTGVAGVGLYRSIAVYGRESLRSEEAWILCAGVAIALCGLTTIGLASEARLERGNSIPLATAQYTLAGLVLAAGRFSSILHPLALILLLLAVCVAQALLADPRAGKPVLLNLAEPARSA